MRAKSKYILVIPLLLSSCLPPYSGRRPTPSLYSGYRAKYPVSSYLLGVGTAPLSSDLAVARRRAKETAFREIAEEIRIKIESSSTDVFGLGIKPKFEVHTRSTVDGVLEGVRIVEATPLKERGIYIVVAVLSRREAVGRLSRKIKMRDFELRRLMSKILEEGNVLERLKNLCRCEVILLHQMALYWDMEALTGPLRIEIPSPEPTLLEIEGRIERLLVPLRMFKMGGEGREGDPLRVKVLYGSLPLQGVPLRWSLASKQGEIEGDAITDEEGVGSAVIRGIVQSGSAMARVGVDPKGLIGGDFPSVLGSVLLPKVTFSISSYHSGVVGAVQDLLQDLSSSGLYGIDIFVGGFSSPDEKIAGDLTLALKDCLAQNLLFQLVESHSGYPYILKGRIKDLGSGVKIMANLTRRGKVITTTSVFVNGVRQKNRN